MRIQCRTLFDITVTGVRNNSHRNRIPFVDDAGQTVTDLTTWHRSRNQQRNWETLNQIISLRTLPENISRPVRDRDHWIFEFEIDSPETMQQGDDALGALAVDCRDVPMLTGLTETQSCGSMLELGQNINFSILP